MPVRVGRVAILQMVLSILRRVQHKRRILSKQKNLQIEPQMCRYSIQAHHSVFI